MPDQETNKNPGNKQKDHAAFFVAIILDLLFLVLIVKFFSGMHLNFALLEPKGTVAAQEKQVIITALLLMLIVVAPVLIAAVWVVRKYRVDNPAFEKNDYQPEWTGNKKLQFLWWAFPGVIVIALGVLTWRGSHALDPYKPLASNAKPVTIEVVALQWKWLFIYPEQNLAAVNYVEFPANTPVNFVLTADAPMNSFWIPQLGSQIYAMAGMTTQLHLMASQAGEYRGEAAEINGAGFAGMTFTAKAVSNADFELWASGLRASSQALTLDEYNRLAAPSTDNPQAGYAAVDQNLYNDIIDKYMSPAGSSMSGSGSGGSASMPMDMNMNMEQQTK